MSASRPHASIDAHVSGEIKRESFERTSSGSPAVRLIVDLTQDRELIERLVDRALDSAFGKRQPEQPPKVRPHPGLRVPVARRPRRKKKDRP